MNAVTGALDLLNTLPEDELRARLLACCGSTRWARVVASFAPFADAAALAAAADASWRELDEYDWREAFDACGDPAVPPGDEGTRNAVRVALALYRERFALPFISAAAAADADELLMRIRIRLGNEPAAEWRAACDELRRSTLHRVQRVLAAPAE